MGDAQAVQERALPELPKGVNAFTHGTIEKAVRLLAGGSTRNEAARRARLGAKDATRVRNLRDGGLLPLNAGGRLVADPRVARAGRRIVLRYVDDDGGRWLDPHDAPPPLRGSSA